MRGTRFEARLEIKERTVIQNLEHRDKNTKLLHERQCQQKNFMP